MAFRDVRRRRGNPHERRARTCGRPSEGREGVTTRAVLSGIAAGCAFVFVELIGRAFAGVPTIPELVQDRLVVALPGPVFAFVLERLLYLGKPLLFASLLLLQIVVLGIVALLVRRPRQAAVLAALLWVVTLLGLRLFAGRLDAGIALVTLLGFSAYGAGLVGFRASRAGAPGVVSVDPYRRGLIAGGVLLLASAVLVRRVIGTLPSLPSAGQAPPSGANALPAQPAESPPGLPPVVTPPDDFYVVSKNITDPVVDAGSWSLKVDGLVDRALELRMEDVQSLPSVDVYRTLECISNEVGGDLMSNGLWTGARLGDVLQKAGVQARAAFLTFYSVDGYTESMPVQKALDPSTLLAYKLDGQVLPQKHGFPLRVLGTGTYGMKNPKWLTRIELAEHEATGFWEAQGWDPGAPVQTTARIDTPEHGTSTFGSPVDVRGLAYAADRGIGRVELSTDEGATWTDVELLPAVGPASWVFWQTRWQPAGPGTYVLKARATDAGGQPQVDRDTDTFPSGATGYHTIHVRVAS